MEFVHEKRSGFINFKIYVSDFNLIMQGSERIIVDVKASEKIEITPQVTAQPDFSQTPVNLSDPLLFQAKPF